MKRDEEIRRVLEALAEPFEPRDVKFKPQMVKNNRALAIAYIDARLVEERLDRVLGGENWQTEMTPLGNGSILCRLSLFLGGQWVGKVDVGSESEQPDGGDRAKAAVSDAIKRAAVQWGIGRYLYRLPPQWVEYDPAKKQLTQLPQLPAFAIPAKARPDVREKRGRAIEALIRVACERQKVDPAKAVEDALAAHKVQTFADLRPDAADLLLLDLGAKIADLAAATPPPASPPPPPPPPPPPAVAPTPSGALPSTGKELHARLKEYDAKLAAQKVCQPGVLLAHVTQAGVRAGYSANMTEWTGPAIPFAVEAVKEFDHKHRQPAAAGK